MRPVRLVAAAVLAASLPFSVAAGDEACDGGDVVLTAEGLSMEYDAPSEPLAEGEVLTVVMDLSGTEFLSGTVTVTADWTSDLNDYDMHINGEYVWNITYVDGRGETASAGKLGHCDSFQVGVDNYTAVDAIDTVTLSFDVRAR